MVVLAMDRVATGCIRIYIGQAGRLQQVARARVRADWTAQIVRRATEYRRTDRMSAAEQVGDLVIESSQSEFEMAGLLHGGVDALRIRRCSTAARRCRGGRSGRMVGGRHGVHTVQMWQRGLVERLRVYLPNDRADRNQNNANACKNGNEEKRLVCQLNLFLIKEGQKEGED